MSAGLTRLGARHDAAVADVEALHAVDLAVRVDDARLRVGAGHHRAQRVRAAGQAQIAVDAGEADVQQPAGEVGAGRVMLGLGRRQALEAVVGGRDAAVAAAGDDPVGRDASRPRW